MTVSYWGMGESEIKTMTLWLDSEFGGYTLWRGSIILSEPNTYDYTIVATDSVGNRAETLPFAGTFDVIP